jgi:integrase
MALPLDTNAKTVIVNAQKTNTDCVIPISQTLQNTILKYGGKMPAKPSLTTFDAKIKHVCRLAGIEKYKLVSSHTARRSLATNLYLAKQPIGTIMSITGHGSEANLRKYLKMDAQDKRELVGQLVTNLDI